MKAVFLGHFAASVAPRILAKVKTALETSILDGERHAAQLAPFLDDAEIVVSHIWRADSPPAPCLRLLQSVAAGLDLLDTGAVPKGVTICNVFGHEPAIAEYVIMTMLVLSFVRGGDGVSGGLVSRTRIADPAPAETVFPLTDLDRMLAWCDTLVITCGRAPETRGLIDARRLALMKPGALLINVARAAIVDEDALYTALKDGHLGGAALDVWWQYPTSAEPERRPSRRPFHELPNVLITPHS
jgi:phosphoglycerate dehydrogenase-like enzyme